MLVQDSPP